MKTALFMLAGCVVLPACTTRVPQGPQPIMTTSLVMPSPTSRTSETPVGPKNELDLTNHYIRISGEVGQPGFYPAGPNTSTLLRAIVTARTGFNVPDKVEIHRVDGTIEIHSLQEILDEKKVDPIVQANDHIHVPKRKPFYFK